MNKLLFILFVTSFIGCDAQSKTDQNQKAISNERLRLKNYAFCMCLNRTYPKIDSITNDGSPAGYFELSAYGIPAFEVLDSLALVYSKKSYKSKYNRNLGMMKCLDFYNSKELESTIVELDSVLDYKRIK